MDSQLDTLSPDAVATLRSVAAARTLALPYPTGREEIWRYTDVAAFRADGLRRPVPWRTLAEVPRAALDWIAGLGPAAGATVSLVDGEALPQEAPDDATGIRVLPLRLAAERLPALLAAHLGEAVGPEDAFAADALAELQDGALIYVPPGVEVAEPVRVALALATAGVAVRSRTVIVVGAHGRLALEEHLGGPDLAGPSRLGHVTEIFLGPGAQLTYLSWQHLGAGARLLLQGRARLSGGASLQALHAAWGATQARSAFGVTLEGAGAEAVLSGVHFASGDQHLQHATEQRHLAPHTRSDLLYKGAVGGAGHAVYTGTIHVAPGARRTDAYQASRNLLLSPRARADVSPRLEIETNDVRCTHGASVGRLDEAQRFYLMSRGLDRRAADRLLVTGFLAEVAARMTWPGLEERLDAAIADKLEAVP